MPTNTPLATTETKQTDTSQALITLKQVSYVVDQSELVSNIDLTILADDMISIIGPNGAGKSTLVKLLIGALSPSSGSLTKSDGLVIGYMPQKFSVPTILPLRVMDLLKQARKNRLTKEQRQQIYTALSLKPLLKKQLVHLSGGETQRVLLARALLEKPDLLILDEPMQGLDPETEELLYRFIDELPDFLRCAMLVVSHDLHWVMKGSRHVVCLNKHICCDGKPADIQDKGEFQALFGHGYQDKNPVISDFINEHKYEQPYIHHHDRCEHFSHAHAEHPHQPTNSTTSRTQGRN